MAIRLKATFPATQYPWGWQVRFELEDEAGRIDNGQGVWKDAPSEAQVAESVAAWIVRLEEERKPPPEPEPVATVICEDGIEVSVVEAQEAKVPGLAASVAPVALTRGRGAVPTVDLRNDSPSKKKDKEWKAVKPLLKSYLRLVWPLYRKAPADVQAALRAHNDVLAALLDMLGEA